MFEKVGFASRYLQVAALTGLDFTTLQTKSFTNEDIMKA